MLSDVTADRLYESWLDVADMSGLSQEEGEREVGVCRSYKAKLWTRFLDFSWNDKGLNLFIKYYYIFFLNGSNRF